MRKRNVRKTKVKHNPKNVASQQRTSNRNADPQRTSTRALRKQPQNRELGVNCETSAIFEVDWDLTPRFVTESQTEEPRNPKTYIYIYIYIFTYFLLRSPYFCSEAPISVVPKRPGPGIIIKSGPGVNNVLVILWAGN